MPLYTYRCEACEHEVDVEHKMADKPDIFCPKCFKQMYKAISPTSFSLKGECWAKDGYQPHTKIRKGAKY